jgi:hypothetical protein
MLKTKRKKVPLNNSLKNSRKYDTSYLIINLEINLDLLISKVQFSIWFMPNVDSFLIYSNLTIYPLLKLNLVV